MTVFKENFREAANTKNDARKYLLMDFNFRSSLISLGGPVIPDRICFNKISDRDVYRAWSPAQNFCSRFPINFPPQFFQATLCKG